MKQISMAMPSANFKQGQHCLKEADSLELKQQHLNLKVHLLAVGCLCGTVYFAQLTYLSNGQLKGAVKR